MENIFKKYDQACKDIAKSIYINLHRNGEVSGAIQVIGYLIAIILLLVGEGLLFGAGAVLVTLSLFVLTWTKVARHFAELEK